MRKLLLATFALAIVIPAPIAWGQNLVVNPDFATDVADWFPDTKSTFVWSSLDADADPASGSGIVSNLSTTSNDASGASQCFDGIVGEVFYLVATNILLPSAQSETGKAHLLVQWFSGPGCGSGLLWLDTTPDIRSSTPDVWYSTCRYLQAPSGTQSARLRLSVWKNEDYGTLMAHFDNVVFEEMIFGDGFESNDLLAWSHTVS
jgi:hypothetical protein